ncbi:unnamed protein product [Notodromas monacha]|uniref:Phosphatidylcholine transfer protein n=1 Tax=Notodromas monacha TaxID=399045 RepID=A0A7R9BEL0_9CRUS|nr:unnamed protein product [Notodromas monacha]CAG0912355.1 unnamed protein product [Notodromas monacha]
MYLFNGLRTLVAACGSVVKRERFVPTRSPSFHKLWMMFIGVVSARSYDWEKERVFEHDMKKLMNEFGKIKDLLKSTKVCQECAEKGPSDKIAWSTFCQCGLRRDVKPGSWASVAESPETVIWKRPVEGRNGQFEYRLYGKLADICAGAWFHVNADDQSRQRWDDTCVELKEVDHDSATNTRVLYWRSKYPYPMKDREYVFKKNYVLEEKQRLAVIYSHDTIHAKAPKTNDKYFRVLDYKSVMIVSADSAFDKEGMEFAMYYYDDQGTDIPQFLVSSFTADGFRNYIEKMRKAAKKVQGDLGREKLSASGLNEFYGLHTPGESAARKQVGKCKKTEKLVCALDEEEKISPWEDRLKKQLESDAMFVVFSRGLLDDDYCCDYDDCRDRRRKPS